MGVNTNPAKKIFSRIRVVLRGTRCERALKFSTSYKPDEKLVVLNINAGFASLPTVKDLP
jgi:hypothetical protein